MDIAPNRWRFKVLLDVAWRRVGADRNGEPDYRGLGSSVGLSAQTLPNTLTRGSVLPDLRTLLVLRDKADIPLIDQLIALDVLTIEEVKRAVAGRAIPPLLSEKARYADRVLDGMSDDEAIRALAWLSQAPFVLRDPDSTKE